MTAAPFFHIGFIVHDLAAAQERFSDVFGVTWTDPSSGEVDFWESGRGDGKLELTVVYTHQGPPHIELLQAHGDGIYAEKLGEGFHHIGVWSPQPARRQDELEKRGLAPVATQFTSENEIIVSYLDPKGLHGVMLELVNEAQRPMMQRWFSGEPFGS